jgi:L-cystine transport system permease protein
LGVIDVIGKVRALGALTYHSLEGYFIAAIIFVVLSIILEQLFAWLGRRYQFQSKKVTQSKPIVTFQPLIKQEKKLPKVVR